MAHQDATEKLKLQLLFLFYKFENVKSAHFQEILQAIFSSHDKRFDVKIAFCALNRNPIFYTDFLGRHWKSKFKVFEKPLKDLTEFRTEIINMCWSDNAKRIKIVSIFIPENCDEDVAKEVEQMLEKSDPVRSFMDFKKILLIGSIKLDDEEFNLSNSLETFISAEGFSSFLITPPQLDSVELSFLKRLDRRSYEEYIANRLKPFHEPLSEGTISADLHYGQKKDFLDRISLDGLVASLCEKIIVKNEMNTIFKDYKIQKALLSFDGTKRICWIERCLSEESLLNLIDIHSTADLLACEFNALLPKEIVIKMSPHYFIKSDSASKLGFLFANYTNFGIEKSVIDTSASGKNEIAEAFMHFSYIFTNKNLIVFDLRSIVTYQKGINNVLLTEPVIFSIDQKRYGASNCGENGIKSYMGKHACNSICKMVKLYRID